MEQLVHVRTLDTWRLDTKYAISAANLMMFAVTLNRPNNANGMYVTLFSVENTSFLSRDA